jgi:F-type H+-transporting ATPase subunit gamma
MATLRDIKRRIKGVQNTQQITKAMKMVAAAKLRRAQDNILNARPYAKKIFSLFNDLVTEENKNSNVFLVQREIKNVAVLVVTADRGLCGAFNTNIIKEASKFVEEESSVNPGISYQLYCVGKKGNDFFGKRNYNILGKNVGLFSSLKYDIALSIAQEIINNYINGKVDKVVIIYNEFKSIIQQKLVIEQYLPVPVNNTDEKKSSDVNFIYEPDQKSVFEYLLPKHLKAQMWRILLESNASELGARMTAMDNATTNAKELIRTLQLKYNKERQAAITKEILEIVSGANALKSS